MAKLIKGDNVQNRITDGDVIITSPSKGFINLAGIESPGLSSAPAIAEYVCDLLSKDGLTL